MARQAGEEDSAQAPDLLAATVRNGLNPRIRGLARIPKFSVKDKKIQYLMVGKRKNLMRFGDLSQNLLDTSGVTP